MNNKSFTVRALVSLLIALLCLGTLSLVSFAADTDSNKEIVHENKAFGQIVPTDKNLNAQKYSYSFYGDKGDIYFRQLSNGYKGAQFFIGIYEDESYTSPIRSFSRAFKERPGADYLSITWNFKDTVSGTYYGLCYAYTVTETPDGQLIKRIDQDSQIKFKINVDRLTRKTVKLLAVNNGSYGPVVSWEPLPTATKYNVYRRAAGEKHWTYLQTLREVNGEAPTLYIDKTAKSGIYYAYTVKAADNNGFVSRYNTKGLLTKYLAMPEIKPISGTGSKGGAALRWDRINGAAGYYVYRKGGTLSDYDWELVANIKNGKTTSFVDYNAKKTDWNYNYTVRAYYGKYKSSINKTGTEFDYTAAPKLTRVSSVYGGLKLQWSTNDPRITQYYVYRKEGRSWKYLCTTKDNFYLDTDVKSNRSYTYTVKATTKTNAGAYNSKGITTKYLASPELSKNRVTFDYKYRGLVKWTPVDGAAGYKIYRKVNNASSWALIATVKNGKADSYLDASGKYSGAKYTYTVRAFDSKNLHSFFDAKGTTGICLAKPYYTVNQLPTEDNSIAVELKWGAITGASCYNVYRKTADTNWVYLAQNQIETSFVDTTAECGVTYQYAVRALNDLGDMSWFYTIEKTPMRILTLEDAVVLEDGVHLNWSPEEKAEKYNVYRYYFTEGASIEWQLIAEVTEPTYIDATDESLKNTYRYAVTCVIGEFESEKSNEVGNFSLGSVKAQLDVKAHTVNAQWFCENADTLVIYKSVNGSEPLQFMVFDTIDQESFKGEFLDTDLEEGNKYTYTLEFTVPNKINSQVLLFVDYPYSPLEKATIISTNALYNGGAPTFEINFEPVKNASEYVIIRSDGVEALDLAVLTEADLNETGSFKYIDESVKAGKKYTYKIKACDTKGRAPSESEEILADFSPLAPVESLTATPNFDAAEGIKDITISFKATEGAEMYEIRRKTGEQGAWEIIAVRDKEGVWEQVNVTPYGLNDGTETPETAVDTLTYVDNTVEENVTYYYEVVAYSESRGEAYAEVVSAMVEVKEPETPESPLNPPVENGDGQNNGDTPVA